MLYIQCSISCTSQLHLHTSLAVEYFLKCRACTHNHRVQWKQVWYIPMDWVHLKSSPFDRDLPSTMRNIVVFILQTFQHIYQKSLIGKWDTNMHNRNATESKGMYSMSMFTRNLHRFHIQHDDIYIPCTPCPQPPECHCQVSVYKGVVCRNSMPAAEEMSLQTSRRCMGRAEGTNSPGRLIWNMAPTYLK